MGVVFVVFLFSFLSPSLGDSWLAGCFGINGPLRQLFSLYRSVSQGGRKKREKIDRNVHAAKKGHHGQCFTSANMTKPIVTGQTD